MRRTKEEAEQTRQDLLHAAVRVFAEKGYAATRLADIAEVAKVTRGAIYWHFGNKQELFVELVQDRIQPFFEVVEAVLRQSYPPMESLRQILLRILNKIASDEEFKSYQQLSFLKFSGFDERNEIKQIIKRRFDRFQDLTLDLIIDGQKRGEILSRVSAADIRDHLVAFMLGITHMILEEEEYQKVDFKWVETQVQLEIDAIRAR